MCASRACVCVCVCAFCVFRTASHEVDDLLHIIAYSHVITVSSARSKLGLDISLSRYTETLMVVTMNHSSTAVIN